MCNELSSTCISVLCVFYLDQFVRIRLRMYTDTYITVHHILSYIFSLRFLPQNGLSNSMFTLSFVRTISSLLFTLNSYIPRSIPVILKSMVNKGAFSNSSSYIKGLINEATVTCIVKKC